MAWIKHLLINIIFVCVSVATALLVAEVALHFTQLQYKYIYPLEPGGYLAYDPQIGFDISPSFATSTHHFYDYSYPVWSNKLGCYDYEYDGNSPYIYFTGDSFTWGFTPLDQKWTKGIEGETGIRSLTCGVNAFGTRQEIIKTSRDLARLPAPKLLVVGYFGGNDIYDDFIFPNFTSYQGYRVTNWTHCDQNTLLKESPLAATSSCPVVPEPRTTYSLVEKLKFQLATHSVLYMLITRQFGVQNMIKSLLQKIAPAWGTNSGLVHGPQQTLEEGGNDVSWNAHVNDILSFKKLAEKYGTKVVFVLIPDKDQTRATSIDPMSANEKVKAVLEENHIDYVDLLSDFRAREDFPKNSFYWSFDGHWDIAGNRLAGLLVSQYLLKNNLLATSSKTTLDSVEESLQREFPSVR